MDALDTTASKPAFDGAALEINLGGEMVLLIAEDLERLGIPCSLPPTILTAYARAT